MTVQYDITRTTPVHAIVEALCVARDESYDELPPLHEYIDTDALNSLLRTDTDASVIFDYQGHTITVRTDSVTVGPAV
ncbi:MAG: HalOD1 output domain-containing protein [Halobacteriota archaeon]